MKKMAVFCGSSTGLKPSYCYEASVIGRLFIKHQWGLVYGGASVGVMGSIADAVLDQQGEVWGVIPQSLVEWEVAHKGLQRLEIVDTMHQRKQRMYDLSDAFLAIPGGMGTLDELCEIVTWGQLKYHSKPIYLYNYEGFFEHLWKHLEHCVQEGFLSREHLKLMTLLNSRDELENVLTE